MKTATILTAIFLSWIQPVMADEIFDRGSDVLIEAPVSAPEVNLQREAIAVAPEEYQGPTNLLPDVEIDLAGLAENTPEQ
jgi:hypothetical protein